MSAAALNILELSIFNCENNIFVGYFILEIIKGLK